MPASEPSSLAVGFGFWTLLLALALAGVAFYAYHRTTPEVSGPVRWVLVGLRAVSLLLLVVILTDPRIVRRVDREESPRVVALVDRSASMTLPAEGWTEGAGPDRFTTAREIAQRTARVLERLGANTETAYFAAGAEFGVGDTVRANGQGTDIIQALNDVERRMEGEYLAAILLFSDGVETQDALLRQAVPGIPVFAVGVGDTTAPDDVRISEVDYSSVVRVPSRSTIEATLAYSGSRQKRVKVTLTEGNRRVFEKDTLMSPTVREVVTKIPVRFLEPGRREFALDVQVSGDDVEPANNTRDIVIEAEKAKARIAIVDFAPDWELHFLTDFLRRDQTFDFDVVTTSRREARSVGRVRVASEFLSLLPECDAVVLRSIGDDFLTPQVASALGRFVRELGGGILVLPGRGSLFETAGAWSRLDDLLPVSGSPPFRFNLQYTSVLPGAQAAANPITSHLMPLFGQTEWQERTPLLGYYGNVSAKPVGEVLLSVRGRSLPAVTYQTVGKGRVVAVSAGPLWRWKFLSEKNTVYDEVMARLLDVLSRGEDTDRFVLTTRKNVFDAGENPVFLAEIFNEKMQPVTGVPVRLEIARLDAGGAETPLDLVTMKRENAQTTRFRAELAPLPPGRYVMRGHAELGDREVSSAPEEIRVSNTSVEFQRVYQDRSALADIAMRSGGRYVAAASAETVPGLVSVEPRTVESVTELTLRTSLLLFLIILLLLSAEWLIRKRSGMI